MGREENAQHVERDTREEERVGQVQQVAEDMSKEGGELLKRPMSRGEGTIRRGNNLFRKKLDVAASQVTVAEKVVGGAWSDETSKVQMPTFI